MSLSNTHHKYEEAKTLLRGKKHIFFIGIGGVHMAALAMLSAAKGFTVSGSDRVENSQTKALHAAGIPVYIGHHAVQLTGADVVVYTLAISPDNPEYERALACGLPLFSRADFLGFLMHDSVTRIGVAGSHGKSTVTAMLGDIFSVADRSPTVVCGAPMRRTGGTFLYGTGKDFIFEACEYGDSFLSFFPTVAVILNAEYDHADYFSDMSALLSSFGKFAALATQILLLPEEASDLAVATEGVMAKRMTFGMSSKADYYVSSVTTSIEGSTFSFVTPKGMAGNITLSVVGEHNIKNALAAAAVADACGVSFDDIAVALKAFRGAARRMERKGTLCGAAVFDDYAHHPTEIAAAISAAKSLMGGGRLLAVFQSHTYSRTAVFFNEICHALRRADRVFVTDIYAARETDTLGMSADGLAKGIGNHAVATGNLAQTAETVLRELRTGDLLLVMGAGDVDGIFGEFSAKGFTL